MIVLPISVAADLFGSSLAAFDVVHGRDGRGVATVLQAKDRRISGALQPFGETNGRWLPEGFTPDSAKVLHTSACISAAKNQHGDVIERQTYVRHGGDVWKVWGSQNWGTVSGGVQRYVLTRYIDPNGYII